MNNSNDKKWMPKKRVLERYPILRILMVVVAAVLMAVNLKTFVHAGGLFPGGFTGLTLLVQEIFSRFFRISLPFALLNLIFNAVPALISYKFIGHRFTLYSCLMIVLSSALTDIIPGYGMTSDILLTSVFGGLLNACAIALCLIAGATSGGTDFIAIFIAQKYNKDAWNYILAFNLVILSSVGFLFGWDKALYSIIFQFASTQTLQVLYRRYQKVTLLIVTDKPEIAYNIIRDETNHDATEIAGTGCYRRSPKTILYSVISADEARLVTMKLKVADPTAFVNIIKSEQVRGRFYIPPKD